MESKNQLKPQREARKHHYVPRFILRRFAFTPRGGNGQLWCIDKKQEISYVQSIANAGTKNDLNKVTGYDGSVSNFEHETQIWDDQLAKILSSVYKDRSIVQLSGPERENLLRLMGKQLTRTFLTRHELEDMREQAVEELYPTHPQVIKDTLKERDNPDNPFGVKHSAGRIAWDLNTKLVLKKRDLLLLYSPAEKFWTSDNPFVITTSFPHGDFAWGVECYYPLAPDLCLAMFCPTIMQRIGQAIDPECSRPSINDPFMLNLYSAFQRRQTLEIGPKLTKKLNTLQVLQSKQQLFSNENSLQDIKDIIGEYPAAKNVESHPFRAKTPNKMTLPVLNWTC